MNDAEKKYIKEEFEYDDENRMTYHYNEEDDFEEWFSYDKNGNQTTYDNSEGVHIEYVYDENGNTIKSVEDVSTEGTTTTIYSGSDGRIEKTIFENSITGFYEEQIYEYDQNGNITAQKSSDGSEILYEYDDRDNLVSIMTHTVPHKMVTKVDGNTVTAFSSYRGNVVTGKAKCNTETDEFNLEYGIRLAKARVNEKIDYRKYRDSNKSLQQEEAKVLALKNDYERSKKKVNRILDEIKK